MVGPDNKLIIFHYPNYPVSQFKNLKDSSVSCLAIIYHNHVLVCFLFCFVFLELSRNKIVGLYSSPLEKEMPVFLLVKFHECRSPAGYSPWAHKKSFTQLSFTLYSSPSLNFLRTFHAIFYNSWTSLLSHQ